MPESINEQLAKQLQLSHEETRELIDGVDAEMIVYEDSGWRIRDLIGHIAAWDIQVSKSIEAFQAGKEYCGSGIV